MPDCSWDIARDRVESLKRISYVDGERVRILTEDGERDFVVGVNLGPTIPGHSPGELAIRAEDYRRWFPQMAELGLIAVRVYTILSPHFYEELAAYNIANPDGTPMRPKPTKEKWTPGTMHIHDLNATILHLLGIDHKKLTYRYQGRDFRLTDVHGHVIRDLIS